MALASRLNGTPPAPVKKGACKVAEFAATLPEDDEWALMTATKNAAWPLTQLLRTIHDEYPGTAIPHYSTFQRHRTDRCACVGA